MSSFYGSKFADAWNGVEPATMKRVWGEELAGYHPNEIRRGLQQLHTLRFPPTLPEFMQLCRCPIDPEAAFYEAVKGMASREGGTLGQWSSPAIYWAAIDFGVFELRQTNFRAAEKRWKHCLEARLRQRDLHPVPEPRVALPAPSTESKITPEEVQQHIQAARDWCKSKVMERAGNHD